MDKIIKIMSSDELSILEKSLEDFTIRRGLVNSGFYKSVDRLIFTVKELRKEMIVNNERYNEACTENTHDNLKLKDLLRSLLNKVNRVTCSHRHTGKVSKENLDSLSNRQIDVEEAFEKLKN